MKSMLIRFRTLFAVLIFGGVLFGTLPASSQANEETGKLKIEVSPKQAYVFVDGKAIREGNQTIELAAGTHEVGVDNYGYTPKTQTIHITSGETTNLNVVLQAFGDKVAGPFGDIEFKGDPRAAVLLNGKTPDYFVGHVDEFDWDWIWHQRLLVSPGTYQVTVTRKGNTIWSGPVTVKAGQKVIVHLNRNGELETRNWPEGNTLGPQPRFHAGIASATVPVAPVTAQLSAQSGQLGCGQSTDLHWKADNAVAVSITNLGNVAPSGDKTVTPTKSTTYELVAKGPGGEVTKTETVAVGSTPTITAALSQQEVPYHKIGDKVVEDGTSVLSWSTSNANKVTITPLGPEALSGSQTIQAKPVADTVGPINETQGYTLQASNACGGTATRTVMLHVTGSIDPPPSITLASVFYPTNYPTRKHQRVGLVHSEEGTLSNIAKHFDNYKQYNEKADLLIVGHADVRGPERYNMALSQRRAELVKDYLISQGMAASEIQTKAVGKDQQLPEKQVAKLQTQDSEKPVKGERNGKTIWLAYNRRVDVVLEPSGQQPQMAYPNDASDARILWERAEPSLSKVESSETPIQAQGSMGASLTASR